MSEYKMTEGMDHLMDRFKKSATISVENPTIFDLYLKDTGLYSAQILEKECILGEVYGDLAYIWEVKHTDFIIIDHDFILDTTNHKQNILNYIREENETSNMSNCFIQMITDFDGMKRFYIVTKKIILANEEIVYSAFEFME